MAKEKTLRQEVIDLYNALFKWQIDKEEKNVSAAVMNGIVGLYLDMSGSTLDGAMYAEKCMDKIKDENKKLEICRKLLQGEKVRIPGMRGDYCIWGVFYDIVTGEKIEQKEIEDKPSE